MPLDLTALLMNPVTHAHLDEYDDPMNEGVGVLEREEAVERQILKPPPRYAVFLLNDDYTPMEFVVEILQRFFNKTPEEAVVIMLKVHTQGRGMCGIYTQDIAYTRVAQVMDAAYNNEHPLQCIAEPVED